MPVCLATRVHVFLNFAIVFVRRCILHKSNIKFGSVLFMFVYIKYK